MRAVRKARSLRAEESSRLSKAAPVIALSLGLCLAVSLLVLSYHEKRTADTELKHRFLHGQDRYGQEDSLLNSANRIFEVNADDHRGPIASKTRQPTALRTAGGSPDDSPGSNPKMGFYFAKDIPGSLKNGSEAAEGQASLQQLQSVAEHRANSGADKGLGFYFDIPAGIKQQAGGAQAPGDSSVTTVKTSITINASGSNVEDAMRSQTGSGSQASTSSKGGSDSSGNKPLGLYFQKDANKATGGREDAQDAVLPDHPQKLLAAAAGEVPVKPALGYYFGMQDGSEDDKQHNKPHARSLLRGLQQRHFLEPSAKLDTQPEQQPLGLSVLKAPQATRQ
ncbi:hypothetical protein WJX72_003428 [[Myrmecia] bisecta]|uniref:Transmembrane protein n=1 Tax=[Myrmecia] bisecta TaxID=41462 RepID=A0AAW1Q0K5_9CHLO